MSADSIRLGITCGDTAGIGLEVLHGALQSGAFDKNELFLYAEKQTVEQYYNDLYGDKWSLPDNLHIVQCGTYNDLTFGKPSAETAISAIESLEKAIDDVKNGITDAIVTLPISKEVLQKVGWNFPGQTEFFAKADSQSSYLMILCTKKVRVALVTIHEPLKVIPDLIRTDRVERTITVFSESLQKDYGIINPRIAVLGLNPHAGENGTIGTEEQKYIQPAIENAVEKGLNAEGCFPADGFFAHGDYKRFDGIIAMYHDQGLIPLKLLAGGGGVNVTAGLSFVRTSPDHGTAYGIAGKRIADSTSMYEAMEMAIEIAKNRKQYEKNKSL